MGEGKKKKHNYDAANSSKKKRVDSRSILLEKIKDQEQNKQGYFVREDNQTFTFSKK